MGDTLLRRDSSNTKSNGDKTARATTTAAELIKTASAPNAVKSSDDMNTIVRCRWCGNKIDEIYLPEFAKGKNGKPCSIIKDYNPCSECKEQWSKAVVIIEVVDKPLYPDCLPIQTNEESAFYPTGRHVGIREDVAQKYIDSNCRAGMIFFMTSDTFSPIFQKNFDKIAQDIIAKNRTKNQKG